MDAFERLSDEHRLIEMTLDAFEQYVKQTDAGEATSRADLERFVLFFREYVDLCHHDKEESILLPALAKCGFHWEDGALFHVRREHEQERYLARSLRHAALQTDGWSAEDRRRFGAVAREFIGFMRRHIDQEERLLFPEARRRLPTNASAVLAADFDRADAERQGDATPPRLREIARELCRSYLRTG